jgi:hypothetical protein
MCNSWAEKVATSHFVIWRQLIGFTATVCAVSGRRKKQFLGFYYKRAWGCLVEPVQSLSTTIGAGSISLHVWPEEFQYEMTL